MQKLRRLIPAQCKHWYRLSVDSGYRTKQREVARLKSLPRYERATTTLTGRPLEVVDAASFLFMHGEIYEQQIYCFKARTPKPFIIDGGANIGLSVLYFKELYPESSIIAFEPDEEVFSVLKNNVERSGCAQVELVPRALWSSETTLSFMHEGADGGRIAQANDRDCRSIRTVRLRDYLDRPVDFLKLDIEGAETEVLADCADRLDRVENLFVEYHSFVSRPQTLNTLVDILARAGFRLHIHPPITSPQPFLKREVHLDMDMQLNVFAFRS
jgi:FkbM family methyltransferase